MSFKTRWRLFISSERIDIALEKQTKAFSTPGIYPLLGGRRILSEGVLTRGLSSSKGPRDVPDLA